MKIIDRIRSIVRRGRVGGDVDDAESGSWIVHHS